MRSADQLCRAIQIDAHARRFECKVHLGKEKNIMNKTIRYAVVGLGHIAQTAVLPAFKHAENSELAFCRLLDISTGCLSLF
jgi:hypothetical protein